MAMPTFTMRQLLEAGVHFGHHTRRWNPKMKPYLFGVRNGVHIVDLTQTVPLLQRAMEAIRHTAANRGRILFVLMTNRPDRLDTDIKRTGRLDILVSEKPRGEGILLWDAKHPQIRRGLKMRWVTADPGNASRAP